MWLSKLKFELFTLLVGSLLLQPQAQAAAATTSSMCYALASNPKNIEGINTDERMPVASVSKLFTSHWMLKSKGTNYRFRTVVYVTPAENGFHDLHFQGSRDPYFGAEKIHYMISELNKRNIKKIRNMTFDENFKYFWFADDTESMHGIAIGFYKNAEPSVKKVLTQMRAYPSMLMGYRETLKKAKKLNLPMVEKPQFTVKKIDHLASSEFVQPPNTQVFSIASRDIKTILKEMNRNSNNFAANQIFEHLGASWAYSQFISKSLKMTPNDVVMLNGSGDRVDTEDGARYNEATCEATLKIIMDLHKELQKTNSTFGQIATIVGTNKDGSASQLYSNRITDKSVIAKTGTVNPSVTLGGIASTKKGLVYFMYIMDPKGNFVGARNSIRTQLTNLIEQHGGAQPINGQSFNFFTADAQSFSTTEKVTDLK